MKIIALLALTLLAGCVIEPHRFADVNGTAVEPVPPPPTITREAFQLPVMAPPKVLP